MLRSLASSRLLQGRSLPSFAHPIRLPLQPASPFSHSPFRASSSYLSAPPRCTHRSEAASAQRPLSAARALRLYASKLPPEVEKMLTPSDDERSDDEEEEYSDLDLDDLEREVAESLRAERGGGGAAQSKERNPFAMEDFTMREMLDEGRDEQAQFDFDAAMKTLNEEIDEEEIEPQPFSRNEAMQYLNAGYEAFVRWEEMFRLIAASDTAARYPNMDYFNQMCEIALEALGNSGKDDMKLESEDERTSPIDNLYRCHKYIRELPHGSAEETEALKKQEELLDLAIEYTFGRKIVEIAHGRMEPDKPTERNFTRETASQFAEEIIDLTSNEEVEEKMVETLTKWLEEGREPSEVLGDEAFLPFMRETMEKYGFVGDQGYILARRSMLLHHNVEAMLHMPYQWRVLANAVTSYAYSLQEEKRVETKGIAEE